VVLVSGFSIICMTIWGGYIEYFNTFGESFISIILFCIGQLNVNDLT